ncbi:MAG: transposase [Candidatus Eisenbacteria bacterium]|nr:transposase [Candidatus Eisenbacteria bacterium]
MSTAFPRFDRPAARTSQGAPGSSPARITPLPVRRAAGAGAGAGAAGTAQGKRAVEMVALECLHLVSLFTVGRKPVLVGDVAFELNQALEELSEQSGYRLVSVATNPDRLDVLVELDGLHRPESVTREVRGLTSLRLMQAFPALRLKLRSNRLWDEDRL